MRRLSFWPTLVFVLVGLLLLREPRFQQLDENFLRWMLHNSPPRPIKVPLTVVDIGLDQPLGKKPEADATEAFLRRRGTMISPLEYALFLQSVLDFQPTVVAFDNILHWRERDKDQVQVFLDQAMRVPKLLLAAQLTSNPDPDAPAIELPTVFTQVTGNRGSLPEFSGLSRQPSEDLRLISTLGFVNLPNETSDDLHIPLLFRYRGEVIPSFTLQAILLWLRVTPREVKIDLRSHISLPGKRTIPIRSDGTLLINPSADHGARRITLNELLLGSQQRGHGGLTTGHFENIRDEIVLARAPLIPLSPPGVFASTIATIQGGKYIHRISRVFDLIVLTVAALLLLLPLRISRLSMFLAGIVLTSGYCLVALAALSGLSLWLPGYFPLGVLWGVIVLRSFLRRPAAERPPDDEVTAAE